MKNKIYVWDPLVRIFHWLLAIAFVTSYLSGEEHAEWHAYPGYLIIGLLAFRLLWGLVGTRHARFTDFVRPLSDTLAYLRGLLTGQSRRYLGHNPAGGLMVLALLASLSLTAGTGLWTYGLEGQGPLASVAATTEVVRPVNDDREDDHDEGQYYKAHEDDDIGEVYEREHGKAYAAHDEHDEHDEHDNEAAEWWEEIHEFFGKLTLLLVAGHLVGVLVSSLAHRENLVRAMITGYKGRR